MEMLSIHWLCFQDEFEEQLPSAASILGMGTTETVIDLSDDDDGNDDDVETGADHQEPACIPCYPC